MTPHPYKLSCLALDLPKSHAQWVNGSAFSMELTSLHGTTSTTTVDHHNQAGGTVRAACPEAHQHQGGWLGMGGDAWGLQGGLCLCVLWRADG